MRPSILLLWKLLIFLVKIAIFGVLLLFLEDLHHALRSESSTWSRQKRVTQISKIKKKYPKNVFFDKNSKEFIKAKLTVSKIFLSRSVAIFLIWHIWWNAIISSVDGSTSGTFISKSIFLANSVGSNSIQTTFKVPGEFCW